MQLQGVGVEKIGELSFCKCSHLRDSRHCLLNCSWKGRLHLSSHVHTACAHLPSYPPPSVSAFDSRLSQATCLTWANQEQGSESRCASKPVHTHTTLPSTSSEVAADGPCLGIFGSRKSMWTILGFKDVKSNADNFECQFWAWMFWGGLKRWRNKAEHFAGIICHQDSLRILPAIFLKFARPKSQIHPKSALRNLRINISGNLHSRQKLLRNYLWKHYFM